MGRDVFRNNEGMMMVEVLIALIIALMVSLALMQTALLGIDSNMKNVLRDEAVRVVEEEMDTVRNTPFSAIANSASNVTRDARKANVTYTVTRSVTALNVDNKQVDVSVAWNWKGQSYTHSTSTIVGNR
jgi:type II secretory pathway pseudopilin PulG